MSAAYEPTEDGDLILPPGADSAVPDIDLIELMERPTALAYQLADDPLKTEWEHQFNCPDVRMYAGSENGKGIVIITGSFSVSPLTGFDDTCATEEDS